MTDAGAGGTSEPQPDLEYDLAHEAPTDAAASRSRHAPPVVCVATETADHDGDYGYDMAHDVPGR